jgi:hypothetical protein
MDRSKNMKNVPVKSRENEIIWKRNECCIHYMTDIQMTRLQEPRKKNIKSAFQTEQEKK